MSCAETALTSQAPAAWKAACPPLVAELLRLAGRSRMTSVPPARSPRRWFRLVTKIEVIPIPYMTGRKSTTRITLRTQLGTSVTGCPPVRTTRRPVQRLPGVRPRARTSKSTS